MPCYVIKGLYDEDEGIFLDELNKSRKLYTDFSILSDTSGYCVGDVYTENELREKFPNANSIEDLEIKLFDFHSSKTLIGYYDIASKNVEFITVDNKNQEKRYEISQKNKTADEEMFYEHIEEVLGEEDFCFITYEELKNMVNMDDIDEIKNKLTKKISEKDQYNMQPKEKDEKIYYTILSGSVINQILELDDIEDMKAYFVEIMDVIDASKEQVNEDFHNQQLSYLNDCLLKLDIGNISYYNDSLYNEIESSQSSDEAIALIDELLDYSIFASHTFEFAKEIGIELFHSRSYFYVQSQMLNKIKQEKSLESIKSKYDKFYNLTRQSLTVVKKELCYVSGSYLGENEINDNSVKIDNIDKVAYVSAQDLVGEYVGQTAPRTEKVIEENLGGIIVLDEAYILAGKAQQYGNEAIAVMLKEMEKNRTMFIFAGYKKEMEDFIRMNSGLESRIGTFLEFKDYSEEELLEKIFNKNIDKVNGKGNQEYKLTVSKEATEKIKKVIKEAKEVKDFGNGRFTKKLFDKISRCHAKNTRMTNDPEKLYRITEKDIPDDIMSSIFFSNEKSSGLYSGGKIGFNIDNKSKQKVYKK